MCDGDARRAGCQCGLCAALCADCLRCNARGLVAFARCAALHGARIVCDALRCARTDALRAGCDTLRCAARCADCLRCAARGLVAFAKTKGCGAGGAMLLAMGGFKVVKPKVL